MKPKQTAIFIVAFLVAAISLSPCAVAEGSFTSSGTVSFGTKGVTPPVNPEDPTESQEPAEVPGTGQEGSLTLDVVPYPNFGEYPVPTLNTFYKSKIVDGGGTPQERAKAQTFIQVSDARPAAGIGWSVGVKADRFINSGNPDNHINGAKLTFYAGYVRGASEENKPDSYTAVLNCINGMEQNEVKVFVAETGNGVGTWVSRLYPSPWTEMEVGADNDMIELFIPANSGAVEGNTYESILTWTLYMTP